MRNEKEILIKHSAMIGNRVTNNEAEYEALIKALELASKCDDEVTCFLDSELLVKQLLGEYRVRNERLLPLFLKVQKIQETFNKIKYLHVRREDKFQSMADELLNEELARHGFKKKWYPDS